MSGFIKDRPRDCQYCYYWTKKDHCTYGNNECYYSKPDPAPKPVTGKCTGCPYDVISSASVGVRKIYWRPWGVIRCHQGRF